MLVQNIARKSLNLDPAPPNIQTILLKLKELKEPSQLETLLLRFYKIHSSDPHINSIFSSLSFDTAQQKFSSLLNQDEVISIIENKYDFTNINLANENKEESPIESKMEDCNTIIKKPIPLPVTLPEKTNDEGYTHQFFSNSGKNWNDELSFKDDFNFPWKNNSINNSFMINSKNLMTNSFNNKILHNDMSFSSPFYKMPDEPQRTIEEFKTEQVDLAPVNKFLNKKRAKPEIIVNESSILNEKKRCLRTSSETKKYKITSSFKKKTNGHSGRNSGFGLKEISKSVKEIIKRVGTTSYKEISDEIVNEINERNDKDTKDEKNIRRRIYDSLNVMKSMKLFRKDKSTKKIVWNCRDETTSNTTVNHINERHEEEDNGQSERISKLNQEIKSKNINLSSLQKEFDCLNTVLERNKNNNKLQEDKTKIYFPFIIIEFPESRNSDSKVKVSMNETKTQAHLAFDSANKLYGDLDAISKIGNNIQQYHINKI